MAVVESIELETEKSHPLSRTVVACTWSQIEENGENFFDLRTFGSGDRVVKGHASQVMQFDEETARQLYRALRKTFDFD